VVFRKYIIRVERFADVRNRCLLRARWLAMRRHRLRSYPRFFDFVRVAHFAQNDKRDLLLKLFVGHRTSGTETASSKFKYSVDLLATDIELLDDFIDSSSGFQILEHSRNGHPGVTKHPSATEPAGDTSTAEH